ncbi:hypothetical protein C427_0992 [Paraglaciecola psychrophila 170]|uniref:Uncharacterized protein n=1 Tax=Paraglaciecola psychrophila 170 TaxID=1129794 RepID=K7A925_9ALTE|nr:hypothetical protein C427_0992 [Paraglaciecola psychrophila 170]GAC38787.1 hypothetical protein GPSY_3176 [Paraglaciecola psychrophila 170]
MVTLVAGVTSLFFNKPHLNGRCQGRLRLLFYIVGILFKSQLTIFMFFFYLKYFAAVSTA